jgi:Ca2+-transporting ATPase
MGQIAELIGGREPPTPLQIELARVGRRLAVVAVVAAVFIFGAGVVRSFPVETMFLTAVAMAVAAIPEGLPAVVTVSLAGGVQRMAHRGAIVRRLPAVEALGAVDVICTDKTGTLTVNDLRVTTVVHDGTERSRDALGEPDGPSATLARIAVLCNDAVTTPDGYTGDPTDVALLAAVEHAGVDAAALRTELRRIDEVQFDSRRKRMSTLHLVDGAYVMMAKGAPEVILARSTARLVDGSSVPLDDDARATILAAAEALAAQGLRTLGFATRSLDRRPDDIADEERDLTYVGMVGFSDEVRPEIESAVNRASLAGVRTVMVTGDHAVTAAAVASAVGIGGHGVMLGSTLRHTDAETLQAHVDEYDVYARVDPVDKVKIVEAWQRSGATVAMTGDGINDAPALHASDIGVAMGTGTDVAREASSLVLADDNYATIVAAIRDGRRIFANLRNVVHYLLSANAAELLYVAVGFLVFGSLGEPLLAVQLLWINLLSDALPAIALGMDVATHDLMQDPPGVGRNLLSGRNIVRLMVQGSILAGAAMITLWAGHVVLDLEYTATRTMVFSTLVAAQLLHALNVRAADGSRLTRPRPLLVVSLAGSLLLQFAVVYFAFGHVVFDTAPLSAVAWLWIAGASMLSFVAIRVLNIGWKDSRGVPFDPGATASGRA